MTYTNPAIPALEAAGVTVFQGDCLEVLRADENGYDFALGYGTRRAFPDESIDAVVTDPPYGLSDLGSGRVTQAIIAWASGDRERTPDARGFMGHEWDAFVPPPAVWDECFRVLKPGGHLLAFAGTRTVDLMGLSIRLAKFEIRDSIAWLYGSGFPKSMNVAAAIDKTGGASPETQARTLRAARERAGMTREDVAAAVGCSAASVGNWEDGRARAKGRAVEFITPGPEYRDALATLLGYSADERAIIGATDDRRGDGTVIGLGHSGKEYGPAATDAAREWAGWGTALKPAFEPIVVARKPLRGTVAANVLAYGTGALNIDATRTATNDKLGGGAESGAGLATKTEGWDRPWMKDAVEVAAHAERVRANVAKAESLGRWPTNVLLDGSQADALDAQTGVLKSGMMPAGTPKAGKAAGILGEFKPQPSLNDTYGDSGGASRFFPTFRYEAKAPASERPSVNGTIHATVKPVELIRWLIRLVVPPGGRVLDPYVGSGTAVEAALHEQVEVVAIEREPTYLPLIDSRIDRPIIPSLFGAFE